VKVYRVINPSSGGNINPKEYTTKKRTEFLFFGEFPLARVRKNACQSERGTGIEWKGRWGQKLTLHFRVPGFVRVCVSVECQMDFGCFFGKNGPVCRVQCAFNVRSAKDGLRWPDVA
jgi:hypothetical protein